MRPLLTLLLLALPLSAGKVTFDGGRFSVEFPEGWEKTEQGLLGGAQLNYQSASGEALFSIKHDEIPAGREADLDGTFQGYLGVLEKSGFERKGEAATQPSVIDGKKALVATLPVMLVNGEDRIPLTLFVVLVGAEGRVITMQATLSGSGTNEQRADCRKIIGSFEEREAGETPAGDDAPDAEPE